MKRAPVWLLLLAVMAGSAGFVTLGTWAILSSVEVPEVSVIDDASSQVRVWVDGGISEDGGILVVQTVAPAGLNVELPTLEVEGLTFSREAETRREVVGDRVVATERYRFRGAGGMYELPPVTAYWLDENDEPQRADSQPIWIDIDVDPPREGEIVDIAEPSAVWSFPWLILAVVGGLLGLLGGGLFVAFRSVPTSSTTERALPPHVIALREWRAVRGDESINDYDTAVELSRIFREYTEAVLGFPASAYTSRQTLDHLRNLQHLPEGNVPRAKRLLRATDLVKYAEHTAEGDFFDDLDADLRAFIDATRPAGGER